MSGMRKNRQNGVDVSSIGDAETLVCVSDSLRTFKVLTVLSALIAMLSTAWAN